MGRILMDMIMIVGEIVRKRASEVTAIANL